MWVSVPEAAERLRVSGTTVRRWILEGHLKASRLPGNDHRNQYRIFETDLDLFIEKLKTDRYNSERSDEA